MNTEKFFKFQITNFENKIKGNRFYGVPVDTSQLAFDSIYDDEALDFVLNWYRNEYARSKANLLPYPLNYHYFDLWISNNKHAIALLQKTINKFLRKKVDTTGILDDKTLKYMQKLNEKDGFQLAQYFSIKRRFYYLNLKDERFRCGWINRVCKLENYILNEVLLEKGDLND